MPLAMEGPRPLSPLEREAVELVFEGSIDPCDVHVTVFDDPDRDGGYYSGDGHIEINRSTFWEADLHLKSAHGNTDILKLANIRCLSTLIHECTHYWQTAYLRYKWAGPSPSQYKFTLKELTELHPLKHKYEEINTWFAELGRKDILNLLKEQHASAAQVYFMIAWQLKHLPKDSDVNLSHPPPNSRPRPPNYVGSLHRYHEIPKLDDDNDGRLFVSRDVAEDLAYHFSAYLVELRSGGREVWAG